jgi:hypothetical protein
VELLLFHLQLLLLVAVAAAATAIIQEQLLSLVDPVAVVA